MREIEGGWRSPLPAARAARRCRRCRHHRYRRRRLGFDVELNSTPRPVISQVASGLIRIFIGTEAGPVEAGKGGGGGAQRRGRGGEDGIETGPVEGATIKTSEAIQSSIRAHQSSSELIRAQSEPNQSSSELIHSHRSSSEARTRPDDTADNR